MSIELVLIERNSLQYFDNLHMVEVEVNELLFHMRNDIQLVSLKKLIRAVCINTEDIIKYLIQNRLDCGVHILIDI